MKTIFFLIAAFVATSLVTFVTLDYILNDVQPTNMQVFVFIAMNFTMLTTKEVSPPTT